MYQSKYIEVEHLPGEPIVLVTIKLIEDFTSVLNEMSQASLDILEEVQEPVFWILDPREFKLNVDTLIEAANFVTRGDKALWRHSMIRQTVLVSSSQMVRLAARGMKKDVFGNVSVGVAESVDEALSYARAQITAS